MLALYSTLYYTEGMVTTRQKLIQEQLLRERREREQAKKNLENYRRQKANQRNRR